MIADVNGNRPKPPRGAQLTCRQVVELVTAYLEHAHAAPERRRFEEHVRRCPDCGIHVAQMRQTIEALGALRADDVPPERREQLLTAFRRWRRQ